MPLPQDPISRLTRRPHIFRIALVAAVTLGITGAVESATGSSQSTVNTGNILRKASIYIFFILCILVALQTVCLVRAMASCQCRLDLIAFMIELMACIQTARTRCQTEALVQLMGYTSFVSSPSYYSLVKRSLLRLPTTLPSKTMSIGGTHSLLLPSL